MFIDLHYVRIGLTDDEVWTLYYPRPKQENRVLVTIQSDTDTITEDLTEDEKDATIRGLITKIQGYMKLETGYMKELDKLKQELYTMKAKGT